jgi:hypothetical protein
LRCAQESTRPVALFILREDGHVVACNYRAKRALWKAVVRLPTTARKPTTVRVKRLFGVPGLVCLLVLLPFTFWMIVVNGPRSGWPLMWWLVELRAGLGSSPELRLCALHFATIGNGFRRQLPCGDGLIVRSRRLGPSCSRITIRAVTLAHQLTRSSGSMTVYSRSCAWLRTSRHWAASSDASLGRPGPAAYEQCRVAAAGRAQDSGPGR